MDESFDADGIVGDLEPERLGFDAVEVLYRLYPHPKADSLLEIRLVDRMGEANRRDDLLDLGVGRIFVEFLVLDRRAEVGRPERIGVGLEQYMRRKELSIELYRVVLADRPIVPGRENQLRVANPPPYPFKRRRYCDPGSDVLSDCAEFGRRTGDLDVDRNWNCVRFERGRIRPADGDL